MEPTARPTEEPKLERIDGLTDKQQKFVAEYIIDQNASRAATAAGYSAKRARITGCGLLKKPLIRKAVDDALAKHLKKLEITVDSVLSKIHETIERCSAPGTEFQPYAILQGCQLLGRHLKMFTDRVETEDTGLIARLQAGKLRVQKTKEGETLADLQAELDRKQLEELPRETVDEAVARAESGTPAPAQAATSGISGRPFFSPYAGKFVTKEENVNA